ncbi:very short patch repair endonuclease [Dyadobacter sandarakinus]|uniref:Very short patch repair endonuclease n=1 Tax=Dyadobacter sandarakinus TaxID=2747268 RepID=A0ABX7IA74_9BACT|nr:very short patch repair endonuclease [Dyadobacter sandarakinus]QRR02623.1 DNA mismatch endonuclease Vsr [Dyadobacter sandarakinus]
MSDVHSPEQRSYNMSRVKGKNTKPELSVRRFLFANGFRYRLHSKDIFGKPDIILRKYKTVIFVHGCFWHGHLGCRRASLPKTNTTWWLSKISQNSLRDERTVSKLKELGWKVVVVWECELLSSTKDDTLSALKDSLLATKTEKANC